MDKTAMLSVKSCVNTNTLRIRIVTARSLAKLKVIEPFCIK